MKSKIYYKDENSKLISYLCYYFKVNCSKVDDKKKFRRQVNLACIRIKEKTGYRGVFNISTGFKDNDFVEDKITLAIKTDKTQ